MNEMTSPVVWLLDDDEAVRESLAMLLECEGFRVRPFESGTALLRALPARSGGCILLDMDMPDMDGLAVMAALRQRGIQIPIIVFTGRGDGMLETKVIRAGARCLLHKPVPEDELFSHLRDACGETDLPRG